MNFEFLVIYFNGLKYCCWIFSDIFQRYKVLLLKTFNGMILAYLMINSTLNTLKPEAYTFVYISAIFFCSHIPDLASPLALRVHWCQHKLSKGHYCNRIFFHILDFICIAQQTQFITKLKIRTELKFFTNSFLLYVYFQQFYRDALRAQGNSTGSWLDR